MTHQLLNCSRNLLLSVGWSQPQQHNAAHKHKQFQNPTIHLHMIILILPCHLHVTTAHSNQQLNTLKPPSHWHTLNLTLTHTLTVTVTSLIMSLWKPHKLHILLFIVHAVSPTHHKYPVYITYMQTHSSVYKKSSGRRNYTLPNQWSLNEINCDETHTAHWTGSLLMPYYG
jgi:hypothetical protein